MSDRSEQNLGLLKYLADLLTPIGAFQVVSRSEQEQHVSNNSNPDDVPIVEVTSDESDDEICLVRKQAEGGTQTTLKLEAFYRELRTQMEQHPDYKIVVSEWFQIDEEHRGRIDIALAGVEVDEDAEVVRLIF